MANALHFVYKSRLRNFRDFKYVLSVIRNAWTAAIKEDAPHYLFFNDSFSNSEEKCQLANDMKVLQDFVTEEEENLLLEELEPQLRKMRYESGHWDNAIKMYRETEKLKWNDVNYNVLERVKKIAFDPDAVPLKHIHVLDLEEKGVIMPHIDSVKFCGSTIAGVSLLSDSVMRLVNDKEKTKVIDVLLQRRSLYIMTGVARYEYTHEILGNEVSMFRDTAVKKSRRISIICRNQP